MEKILVVEDEKDIRESLFDILEMAGYTVKMTNNGKAGFESILEDCPDMVICDVNMPELDGFELLGAINQRFKEVPPFIFLTAKVEKHDLRNGMCLGADDYILKPFDHNELLQIVRLRLDKRKVLVEGSKTDRREAVNTESNDKLALPTAEGLDLILYSEIIKCEADRSYCVFYLTNGSKILVSRSMKDFEKTLLLKGFLKVHKSTIINIKHANQYIKGKGGLVRMCDGSVVSVSVRKKEELMTLIKSV